MKRDNLLWLLIGGAVVYWLYTQRNSAVGGTLESAAESAQALVMGWQNVNEGPTWVPVINQTESALGIPPNLLARQAYEESRFRADVISGATTSSAGALGILQLEPAFFKSVGPQVPLPYSPAATTAQISEAGQEMVTLFNQFGDWGLALAAYNWGSGNLSGWLTNSGNFSALPQETQNYVTQILADVPVQTALVSANA